MMVIEGGGGGTGSQQYDTCDMMAMLLWRHGNGFTWAVPGIHDLAGRGARRIHLCTIRFYNII